MQSTTLRLFVLFYLFSGWTSGFCQQQTADDYFTAARDAAFKNKNYQKAIQLSKQSLELAPNYTEVALFLANLYTWNNLPDSARRTLLFIRTYSPTDSLALSALAKLEYDQKEYTQSNAYCNEGISAHPLIQHFKLVKARNQFALGHYREAADLCKEVLAAEPGNRDAALLQESIKTSKAKNTFGIRYDYTWFDKQFTDPWIMRSLQYSRITTAGPVIARINFGSRYGQQGMQAEIDAYPRITKKLYAYVSGGYSANAPVFPRYRGGFSLYANLPNAFEAEAGIRYLKFDNATWIYTASAGKYFSDLWLNVRAYLTPNRSQISHSYAATAKYFLKNENNYFMLNVSSGISPDDRIINAQLNSTYRATSKGLSGGYQATISQLNMISFEVSYTNIEFQPKIMGKQVSAGIQYQRRF